MLATYRSTEDLIERQQPELPVNCLSLAILKDHVTRFCQGFPGTVAYAVKANPAKPLLHGLSNLGINHFDVASVTEIELLRSIQPGATLLYDNPVKSRLEIEQAYSDFAVRSFAIDDPIELKKIHNVIGADADVEVSVRFNIGASTAVYDLGKKFGTNDAGATELLSMANDFGYRTALTFHPGSQCTSAQAYNEYIERAANIEKASSARIEMLNIGGGFPTVYPNSGAPKLRAFFDEIEQQFTRHFSGREIVFVCEPGRALVDPAISILTRVKHRRDEPIIFLNDGIYGGFMEQLLARVELPTRVFRGNQVLNESTIPFTVFGPTCDSLDIFSYEIPLPESTSEGDWIEFGEMGGYGSSTATVFNGYGTGEYVYVEQGFSRDISGITT